jgi:thiol:disulfide interchange protein
MRTLTVLLMSLVPISAQFDVPLNAKRFSDIATIEATISPKTAKPGEIVSITLTVTPKPGCTTYPTAASTGQSNLTKWTLESKSALIVVAGPVDPSGVKSKPGATPKSTEQYFDDAVTWTVTAVIAPKAAAGKIPITLDTSFVQCCTEGNCFKANADDFPRLEIIVAGDPVAVDAKFAKIVEDALTSKRDVLPTPPLSPSKPLDAPQHTGLRPKPALPVTDYEAKLETVRGSLITSQVTVANDLAGLLMAAAFWGFVSLVTPCVFPMIPITVSLFLKKSQSSGGSAITHALIYSLTIIVVLGLSAVALLSVFRRWSVSLEMNLFLGVLFVAFAFSLFGWYDIALPGSWLRATERRRASGGYVGTVFGALAFSIVSFTCVAPFLGGFAGIAASGSFSKFELVLAGLVFAAAFASPFFVLALFPSLLKRLPRSGGWLDVVKAVMGFLELAAAFKFFRTAELRYPPVEYFTYDVVLVAWVVIFAACGLYLLGFFKLPHDEPEAKPISVPRLVFALLSLGLAIHLLPGLFKGADGKPQRPNGVVFAWIDAFLLPEPISPDAASGELPWSADLAGSIDRLRRDRLTTGQTKRIFVDFTGVTCTNCKYNEANIFTKPKVREALLNYDLVQLYTDDVPAELFTIAPPIFERNREGKANLKFQESAFGTQQLPLYVILEPLSNGKTRVVGVYSEGKINNPEAFLKFLQSE